MSDRVEKKLVAVLAIVNRRVELTGNLVDLLPHRVILQQIPCLAEV